MGLDTGTQAFAVATAAQAAAQIGGGIAAISASSQTARSLRKRGAAAANDRRLEARKLLARQRLARAASGVDVGSGSALDVLADTAAEEELAALRSRFAFTAEALAEERRGAASLSVSLTRATGTLLSSFAAERNLRVGSSVSRAGNSAVVGTGASARGLA